MSAHFWNDNQNQILPKLLQFLVANHPVSSNTVDNNEYFSLGCNGDDTTSGESGSCGAPGTSPDRQSRSPPSTSDYQSDLSTNGGVGNGVGPIIGGDSGHYSSFHSTSSFGSNHNNNNNINLKKGTNLNSCR